MNLDEQTAGSSPAPEAPAEVVATTAADLAVASKDVGAYREAKQAERLGKPLDAKPAESSPAKPAEQAASTDASAAASEAAKPRKTGEDRAAELKAEIQELLKQRSQLRHETAPRPQAPRPTPASEPAPAKEFPTYEEYTAQAGQEFAPYEQYLREQAKYVARQEWESLRQTERREAETVQRTQERQARILSFNERISAAKELDPDFDKSISDDVAGLPSFDAVIQDEKGLRHRGNGRYVKPGYVFLAEKVLASDVAPQLMRHFSAHADELHKFANLLPDQQQTAFARLEGRIEAGLEKTEAKEQPVRKTVTDAPKPPTTLGGRSANPADPVDAAVAAKDVASFRRLKDAERRASVRR
jgi:hypothetical protein